MKSAVLVILGVLSLTPPIRAYAQCIEFDRPAKLFALSDLVFVGTVLTSEPTGVEGDHVIVSIATFRLERSWKGRLDREVRVGSDLSFEVGRKYVVFAAGKPLSTTILCRWAERVDRAKRKLDWLASKRSRPAR